MALKGLIEGFHCTNAAKYTCAIKHDPFDVNCSVEDEDQPDLKDLLRKKKRVFEAPRAQNYYHVEYYLIPGDDELMKTDIVTYGMAAKLYMERHDARVIKTWQDGELTWIAWAHRWVKVD